MSIPKVHDSTSGKMSFEREIPLISTKTRYPQRLDEKNVGQGGVVITRATKPWACKVRRKESLGKPAIELGGLQACY